MNFAGLNYLAIAVAGVAGFVFGAIWYGALGKPWMAALGKTKEELMGTDGKPPIVPMVIALVAQLVMAWVLAGVIGHLGAGQVTLKNGVISALFLWFGFVATTLVVNHGFQGAKRMLTVIDGGHWLGVLLVMGAVIGWFGV